MIQGYTITFRQPLAGKILLITGPTFRHNTTRTTELSDNLKIYTLPSQTSVSIKNITYDCVLQSDAQVILIATIRVKIYKQFDILFLRYYVVCLNNRPI